MEKTKFFRKNSVQKIGIMLVMLLYATILYVFQVGCPILRLTGIPCPGCGMTRAWLAVLKLDFAKAFSFHAMFWAVPILCAFLWCDGNLFQKKEWNQRVCIGIAIGFLINWLYKVIC